MLYYDNKWIPFCDDLTTANNNDYATDRTDVINYNRKIIPYPTNCKNCGAAMHSYKCEYCDSEYPKYTEG